MVAILRFRKNRCLPESNGRPWREEEALNAGYLSREMFIRHLCAYCKHGREGQTYCHICGQWVMDNSSMKCYCSWLEETLSECDSWRKAVARGKKHLWLLGAQPGKMVWQPYDNLEK